ncbi:MetQ/NlpA family ABC transporter substrate-binding protein [Lactobacillus sp. YT155]|uniref:MetQ/NlpA family ABC transporter substrate-binding protein n=1 Tax=Lactobacillus sp. YT155 TaxID=3060955 RepID=UPI00265E3AC3|nr:MetQ/NlpA family ABC transporter substrate-binding protein [Lactobacillus sp. YT155]MDO1605700.1 MetQ/NlpA family ABC transporter substrate-binding protein [Lactobacillus sp. YT155]
MKKFKLLFLLFFVGILLVGCKESRPKNRLVVGATSVPHAEILKHVKPELKKQGIDLEIKVFNDYVLPNAALDAKELDANYYQHIPYMNKSNKDNGYHIVSAGKIHLEPLGLYSKRISDLSQLKDKATVLVSSSRADWGRVLSILAENNVLTLKPGTNIETASFKDIKDNPKKLKFKYSFDPKLMPELYKNNEGDLIAINSNFAVEAGLNPQKAVVLEPTDSPYANVVAVNRGHKDDKKIKALLKVLKKKETQDWILKKWHYAVLPVK